MKRGDVQGVKSALAILLLALQVAGFVWWAAGGADSPVTTRALRARPPITRF